jgi:hypothetical protein
MNGRFKLSLDVNAYRMTVVHALLKSGTASAFSISTDAKLAEALAMVVRFVCP